MQKVIFHDLTRFSLSENKTEAAHCKSTFPFEKRAQHLQGLDTTTTKQSPWKMSHIGQDF